MSSTEQIVDWIDSRLDELHREIAKLHAARAALAGSDGRIARPAGASRHRQRSERIATSRTGPASSSRSPRAAGSRARVSRRGRKRPRPGKLQVVVAGVLEQLLSDSGSLSTAELAERARGERNQVLTVLRELEVAGRIRRTGQRRGTRWHVITDEERIQQRAADLASRRRSAA